MQRAQREARGPVRTEREARRSNRAPQARSNFFSIQMKKKFGNVYIAMPLN